MAVQTTLSSLSQTASSNGPDGASDPPSALDDQQRYHGSFIATLRDGKGFSAEVDVASAATCDIGGANSLHVRVTGTTTITSLGTNYNGPRFIRFGGALTLTHNASTLILPGGASITTAAGDCCVARPISGGWVVSDYQRATTPLNGAVIDRTYAAYTANADLTAQIPADDTIPQNSEGTQIISVSFTPKTTTNRLRLRFQGEASAAVAASVVAALFSSASASAIRSTFTNVSAGQGGTLVIEHEYVPATTSALTFSVRVGPVSATTVRMNGTSAARFFGGTMAATLVIEEIAA